ncbi:MAG: hypothetical protein HY758_07490, partial [Nitrospirae bacterium]|nr:hypothetical protein [Nitrospirota bacterium]
NRDVFLNMAKEKTGLNIEIIPGDKEAEITAAGMLIGFTPPGSALMIDIGGGSTEMIFSRRRKSVLVHSIDLGVLYLADKYMKKDPPLKKDLGQMEQFIAEKIMPVIIPFNKLFSGDTVLIGTAGTVTALSAMSQNLIKFEHSKIHNSRISFEQIRNMFAIISEIPARERIKYHPFDPQRLDIIVPGTLILLKLMETFGFKEVTVSNYGLREGILIDLYEKIKRQ